MYSKSNIYLVDYENFNIIRNISYMEGDHDRNILLLEGNYIFHIYNYGVIFNFYLYT